ncbi:hypothetical protein [Pseudomonas baetica]|uniref:hypothetical protein n=1 Tax=Pseudomonas baetica TaxID=674054 RepID=UPI001FC9CBF2|nr:hypothetical protein [Pseudomonas baetica]
MLELEGRVETSIKLGGAIITQRQVLGVLRQALPDLHAVDLQMQIERQAGGARLLVVIARDKLPAGAESAIERELQRDKQACALLRLPGVLGLQVQRLERHEFETTLAGKTPFFFELGAPL